jgi:hypothetical protein
MTISNFCKLEHNKRDNVRTHKYNIKARSRNHCGLGKALLISITYPERVFVALAIQHATRMHHLTVSSVAFPDIQYFSTLSTN